MSDSARLQEIDIGSPKTLGASSSSRHHHRQHHIARALAERHEAEAALRAKHATLEEQQRLNSYRVQAKGLIPSVTNINQGTQ